METIFLLSKIDYRSRYHENKLGVLWALIRPIMEVIVYYIAFKYVLGRVADNFLVFLFLGQITWLVFVEISSGMINLLESKRYLYEYSQLKKMHIYIAYILTILRGFAFNLFIYILLALAYHVSFSWQIIWTPLILLVYIPFFLGTGMILSIVYLFIRDITQFWSILIFSLYWMTPIIMSAELYEQKIPWIKWANPLFGFVENMRNIWLRDLAPDFFLLGIHGFYSLFFLGIGIILLNIWGSKSSELL